MVPTFPLIPARIVAAYGPANVYHIVGPFVDDVAVWMGEGSGTLGVRSCGGLAPGTRVLVALASGDNFSRIVAVDQGPTIPDADAYTPRTLGDPTDPAAGYFQGSWERQILDGSYHIGLRESRNDGFQDLVNGEWGRCSYFGAAVLVEYFRSALRAGAFAELAFYTSDQSGHLRTMKWAHDTLFGGYTDTSYGGFPEQALSRFVTPTETTDPEALPREQGYAGLGHLGSHRVLSCAGRRGEPRRGLSWDYTDLGGTRVIGAAGGVIMERRIDLDVPEELDVAPEDAIESLEDTLEEPRPEIDFEGPLGPLLYAQGAWDIVDAITTYRSRNAIDATPERWRQGEIEPADHDVRTPLMWGELPKVVELQTDTGPKKFYVGRSCFALLPDGNVLVENAHGAQIMAVGPNIVLSAPGDIIEICGGVKQTYAQGVVTRGYEFVQVVSPQGEVDLKAETNLKMVGANSGRGGVLIESKSTTPVSETAPGGDIGGLVMKSASGAFVVSEDEVGISGRRLTVVSDDVFIDAELIAAKAAQAVLYDDSEAPVMAISRGSAVIDATLTLTQDLVAQGGGLFGGDAVVGGSVVARGSVVGAGIGDLSGSPDEAGVRDQIRAQLEGVSQNLELFNTSARPLQADLAASLERDVPLRPEFVASLGFSFTTGYDVPDDFGLPETRWQQRNRDAQRWEETGVTVPEDGEVSMAYPGREVWEGRGVVYRAGEGLFFDAASARSTMSKPDIPTAAPGAPLPLATMVRSPR